MLKKMDSTLLYGGEKLSTKQENLIKEIRDRSAHSMGELVEDMREQGMLIKEVTFTITHFSKGFDLVSKLEVGYDAAEMMH